MGLKFWGKKDDLLQKQINIMQEYISSQNELNQALYGLISKGQGLSKDSKLKDYVDEGYAGNPDVFGVLMKLAKKFTTPEYRIVTKQSNGKLIDVNVPEFEKFLKRPNYYQNFTEFKQAYFLFKYVTGNGIVYAPKIENGQNKGKLTNDGLTMMPTQNTTIHTGGWREPIGYYTLDLDQRYKLQPTDVWHERITNLNMMQGEHLMGMSPLKVATNIINSQNSGYELTANMYKGGHPPGILSKETDGAGEFTPQEQEEQFRKHYKRKYLSSPEDTKIPVFTLGKINFTAIGYNSVRDLQVIEMSEHGLRVLCNIIGVAPQLFGDTKASTYNNMSEAATAMWEDLLIPECNQFYEGLTEEVLPAYGDNLQIIPVYDNIRVLQEDRERAAKIYQIGVGLGAYSPNEFREKMGDEPVKEPGMDDRYIPGNMFPIGAPEEISIDTSDKFYEQNNLKDKL